MLNKALLPHFCQTPVSGSPFLRILNLYAGIGGNRKLWTGNIKVTAIEYDQATADVYKSFFPGDEVIVCDAHEYLLKNYMDFDFIWSSPPCPSHSDIRRCGVHAGQYEALYPEMSLYQEIILLKNFAPKETKFVVENVKPYYEPLIQPDVKLHRHFYWCNFRMSNFEVQDDRKHSDIQGYSSVYGFDIKNTQIKDKRKALRNMVDPELGLHIFNCAMEIKSKSNSKQVSLFDEVSLDYD
jgi:DNA (cytosine-5)-methyltransferase 1